MWAEWGSRPGKSWGPVPSPDWFDEQSWTFLDVDGSERTVSRRDAIALLAAYDADYSDQLAVPQQAPAPPPPPPPPAAAAPSGGGDRAVLGARPPMVGAAAPPRRAHRRARPMERELLADNHPMVVTPHNAGQRLFGEAVPPGARGSTSYATQSGPAAPTLNAPELADSGAKILIELTDISFKLVPSSGFAVYLDCDGQTPSTDPVGLIDIFGATHHGAGMNPMTDMGDMHRMKAAQRFDVTAVVRRSPGPFTLRVEPYELLVTHDGKPTRGRADAVTIGSVRFVVLS
jgi:hypothetical protein